MQVPPDFPHPQTIMMAGFFEFEDIDKQFWSFCACVLTAFLAFVLYILSSRRIRFGTWEIGRENTARNLLVVEILFGVLSFPLIKKLTSVFSCTSTSVMEEIDGSMQLFCNLTELVPSSHFVVTDGPCTITNNSRCFRSPNFPAEYDNWDGCEIEYFGARTLATSTAFDTESGEDYLTIDEELYSGNDTVQVLINHGSSISWDSDWSDAHTGFEVCVPPAENFTRHIVDSSTSCMDNDPTTACWEAKHFGYVFGAMALVIPYYLFTLHLQIEAQKQQSVVVIDGVWTVVSLQNKFILAVIASAFGDCYPHLYDLAVRPFLFSAANRGPDAQDCLCCGGVSHQPALAAVHQGLQQRPHGIRTQQLFYEPA
eukprot:COSAG04_NODE_2320_length_4340_cov_3.244046_1_plen_369_part_00